MSNLRWKMVLILVVVFGFGAVGVYPLIAGLCGIHSPRWLIDQQLKLGLDLRGGVQLVLRVQTEYALRAHTEAEAERLRDELQTRGIATRSVTTVGATEFRVDGIPHDQEMAFRQVASELQANFDRSPGANGIYTFTMKSAVQSTLRDEALVQERETIVRRANELGVSEPSIARQGANGDEILVQLPGVANVESAKNIIQTAGMLEFRLVDAGPSATRDALIPSGQLPPATDIVSGPGSDRSIGAYYLVHRAAAVTGRDLRNARTALDENNQPMVRFTLTAEGGRKFAKVTADNIGRQLAIILDGRVQSSPVIENRIAGDVGIHGTFSQQEAQDLAMILRSGALPAPVSYLEEHMIGPSLGVDSIRSGILASVLGLLLIVSFMLVYYRFSGINAIVTLLINLTILLGLMAYIGAVMTLPGIAGFVLTMGIGIDSNVLIFERIKEELGAGLRVPAAINTGFGRVLTLLDTHISALIAAAFLFQFGTGPIRGFAVTLSIGLLSNLFTSTFVSKTLFEAALARKRHITTLSI